MGAYVHGSRPCLSLEYVPVFILRLAIELICWRIGFPFFVSSLFMSCGQRTSLDWISVFCFSLFMSCNQIKSLDWISVFFLSFRVLRLKVVGGEGGVNTFVNA